MWFNLRLRYVSETRRAWTSRQPGGATWHCFLFLHRRFSSFANSSVRHWTVRQFMVLSDLVSLLSVVISILSLTRTHKRTDRRTFYLNIRGIMRWVSSAVKIESGKFVSSHFFVPHIPIFILQWIRFRILKKHVFIVLDSFWVCFVYTSLKYPRHVHWQKLKIKLE